MSPDVQSMSPDHLISLIYWIICNGPVLLLLAVAAVSLCAACMILWNPWRNRIAKVAGYNSIADQLKGAVAGKAVNLQSPPPPEHWSTVRQIFFRAGQLEALRLLESRNARIQRDIQKSLRRAKGGKRRS